jgi:hypothetical protein
MEKQAHRFAGALLLPAESFASEVRIPANLDNLLILKQRWGTSVAAMMMRLHALGLLNDDEKLVLFKRRSARWGSKSEPGDEKWAPEIPRLLRRTVDLLVNESIVPADVLPRHLGFSPTDIIKICSLRDNYFDEPATIIELATLRNKKPNNEVVLQEKTERSSVVSFRNFRK